MCRFLCFKLMQTMDFIYEQTQIEIWSYESNEMCWKQFYTWLSEPQEMRQSCRRCLLISKKKCWEFLTWEMCWTNLAYQVHLYFRFVIYIVVCLIYFWNIGTKKKNVLFCWYTFRQNQLQLCLGLFTFQNTLTAIHLQDFIRLKPTTI